MKRLLLVFNPRSSHFWQVERDILTKVRELRGWMVGKYEISDTDVDDNARKLSKIVMDGDIVVAAGGDGTANIAVNGILLSGATGVKFGVMGYGNFNDMARMFGDFSLEEILEKSGKEVWPLECRINGKHWRYAMCYFTVGMFAEACAVFDKPEVRKKLQKKHRRKSLIGSIWSLSMWWFREHKREFLPDFSVKNSSDEMIHCDNCSDYMAINSPSVARIMKGGDYYRGENYFLSNIGCMTKFFKLISMMMRSMFKKVPGIESDYDCLILEKASKIMLQAEGEYKMIDDVKTIEIEKTATPMMVVMK